MTDLVLSHGGDPGTGWWPQVREHSLGWVSARNREDLLVGFVDVARDGGDRAFLIDTGTRGSRQRRGIGREVVRSAARNAAAAGCEWLRVGFRTEPAPSSSDACGSTPTEVGPIHLKTVDDGTAAGADRRTRPGPRPHLRCQLAGGQRAAAIDRCRGPAGVGVPTMCRMSGGTGR